METQYLLKCYNDGTFEINGKKGKAAELPDCNDKSATTTQRKVEKDEGGLNSDIFG